MEVAEELAVTVAVEAVKIHVLKAVGVIGDDNNMQESLKDYGLFDPVEDSSKHNLTFSERIRDYNYKMALSDMSTDIQREQIRSYIYQNQPVTDIEIAVNLRISRTSVCARRNELPEIGPVSATQINGRLNTMWGRKQL